MFWGCPPAVWPSVCSSCVVHPSVNTDSVRQIISLFSGRIQWTLAQIFNVWVPNAEKIFKIRGQRSRSKPGQEIFSHDSTFLYLVGEGGFHCNLSQIFIMVSGHCWKGFQGQRSKVKIVMRTSSLLFRTPVWPSRLFLLFALIALTLYGTVSESLFSPLKIPLC